LRQRHWLFRPAVALSAGQNLELSFGPELQRSTTDSVPNRYLAATRPYGFGTFNQAGLQLSARYALRPAADDRELEHTHHQVLIDATARYMPALMDLRSAFEAMAVTMSASRALPLATHPLLAVRVGGKKVFD